ncbi:maleylpyruvate isomerase N-terminal domain-containing protein, partial [Nocardia farcinica]|uniref:maleylpyruvate isomerase N-terminal domain-containing protein n=1 Tax=Nocardia farcinica TaxID=37329 RepID=UPI002454A49F
GLGGVRADRRAPRPPRRPPQGPPPRRPPPPRPPRPRPPPPPPPPTSLSADELRTWLGRSADDLDAAMRALTDDQWAAQVVTAQGRTVPATETAWMRAREVWVHSVDLALDIGFGDLPADFLRALVADISAKRGAVAGVDGPLPQVAAWLAGRPHTLADAPPLGPWL